MLRVPDVSYPNLFVIGVSYPVFLKRVRVLYLNLGLGLFLMLGLGASVRVSGYS